jgi:hypothetical protein
MKDLDAFLAANGTSHDEGTQPRNATNEVVKK